MDFGSVTGYGMPACNKLEAVSDVDYETSVESSFGKLAGQEWNRLLVLVLGLQLMDLPRGVSYLFSKHVPRKNGVSGSTALSAMANAPIGGVLVEKYGYLSLSLFSGVSLLLGGILLAAASLVQKREFYAVV